MFRARNRSVLTSVATLGAMYLLVSQSQSMIVDNEQIPPEWRVLLKTMLNGGRRPADMPAHKQMSPATPAQAEKIQNLTVDLDQLVNLPGFGDGTGGARPAEPAHPAKTTGTPDLFGKQSPGSAKKQPGREAGSGPLMIHNDTIHDNVPTQGKTKAQR